jgi:hypothetical protein
MLVIKVNGQEVPYARNSIDLDDAVGQRSTASFSVVDKAGDMRFKKGQNVTILQRVPGAQFPATWEDDDLNKTWEGEV